MSTVTRTPRGWENRVGKNKPKPKATLYVEIDPKLKARIDASALRNARKINGEVAIALEYYLAATEPKAVQPPKKEG